MCQGVCRLLRRRRSRRRHLCTPLSRTQWEGGGTTAAGESSQPDPRKRERGSHKADDESPLSHSYPLRFRRAPSPPVANTLSRRRLCHDVKEAFGSKLFFLLFYCISGAPLFIQRMARAWRYYGTSDCRQSSSRVKEKRHGEYGHTSVWLCGRVRLCLSPRLLVRFLPLLHSSPSSCIPPHSLSLFPFFFCCRLPDGKATGKKKSVLWGAKARTYTLLFSSRSFFGLRHDDSYHNYTLSRQQSSVLRENKQTKKRLCVHVCLGACACM